MAFKFWHYFFLSSVLLFSMVVYACITREQFYPIILLLVTSKVSFLLIANMIFACTLLFGQIMIKLFFGTLRDVEYELILERAKYSITETCLALTIFRNDLTPNVFLFFLFLLFLKVFHWLSRSRLDYLEQIARISFTTHLSLFLILLLLILLDSFVCYHCMLYSYQKGKTVIVLFAFEFGILILIGLNNLVRYLINLVDGRYENGLHFKGLYFMILDLICDGLKFCTYAGFFCLVFVYYGLPIHIIRDVWMAFASFYQRLVSLIKYLKLTNRLEERFQDATPEELAEAHECLICREGMDRGKKLPCKHVFHLDCLRMWLQHQQTCPLCRAEIPIVTLPNPQATPAAPEIIQQPEERPDANIPDQEIRPPLTNILPAPAPNHTFPELSAVPRYTLDDFELSVSSTIPTAPNTIENAIPGFFVILANEDTELASIVEVKSEPNYDVINPTLRSLKQGTIVFASELRSIPLVGVDNISIIWLRLPDGWIPFERYDVSGTTPVYTPIVRPYSPIMTKKNLLGDFTETPPLRENSILPQSAATPERASSSSRPRDPASRRDLHFRQGHRSKHHASPTSISRAILKAREDITALSLSLRETSSAQAKMSSPRRFPQYAPSPTGKSTSSDRVVRLLAMQQQIDVLATSIMEIQESLSGVRQGLAAALADELSAQEQVMDSPKKPTRAAATSPIPPPQLDTLEPSNFENPVSVPINETEPSIPDLVGDMPTNPISSTPDDVRAARAKYFANSTANSVNGEGARDVSVVSSAGSQDSARVIPEADLEEASKTVKEDAEQTAASTTFKEEVEG